MVIEIITSIFHYFFEYCATIGRISCNCLVVLNFNGSLQPQSLADFNLFFFWNK